MKSSRPPPVGSTPPNDSSDEQLMASMREGDTAALQILLDRHWTGVYGYAYRLLGEPDDADDVAQDVFVRVWEHRGRWKARGSARSYLYRVARNLVLLRRRHEAVQFRAAPEVRRRSPGVTTPAEELAQTELKKAFERAFQALSDQRREAFLLVRLRGLSFDEAAQVMGITKKTVANHTYLGARDLEEVLRPFLS